MSTFAASLFLILLAPSFSKDIYLDPGSGSLLIQMIIAGVAGFGYIMRHRISQFFGLFRRKKKDEEKKN